MLYVLDRDEQIRLFPDTWGIQHTEGLNRESVLEFYAKQEIDKYEHVLYQDADNVWHEFIVSGAEGEHTADEVRFRIYAESVLTELMGDWLDDRRVIDQPLSTAMSRLLEPTRWTAGTLEPAGNGTVNYYRESAYTALGKVIKAWDAELSIEITVSGGYVTSRKIHLWNRLGVDTHQRFEWTHNVLSVKREILRDDVITALHGYGRGEEVGAGFGRRISFADINGGLSYVANEDSRRKWGRMSGIKTWEVLADNFATWGAVASAETSWQTAHDNLPYGRAHRHGKVEFDNITDKAELLVNTQATLAIVSQPQVTYEASVVDLAALGLPRLNLGDGVIVIDDDLGIEQELRVIELVRDPMEPLSDKVTLGQLGDDYARAVSQERQTINDMRAEYGVSRMVSMDGKSWIDYAVPEFILQGDSGKLEISPDVIFRLYDELGKFVAGFADKDGQKGLVTKFIGNDAELAGGVGQIGAVANGAGFKFDWDGRSFFITVLYNQHGETGFGLYIDGKLRMMFMGDHGFWVFDGNLQNQIYFDEYQGIAFGDSDNVTRFYANDNQTTLRSADNKEVVRHSTSTGATELISSTNSNHAIGVDNNGPYRIKNGTKTYF